ncbi:MAG: hypothetical protein QOJ14_2196 [Thermoleophilaceae bacterium]|nr:hypothetical protein [Thermoleophilaceae bacterium]
MSLTRGTGPFAPRRAGVFNFELGRTKGLIYFEDSPRRIRAILAGETIVDSRRSKLLHEQGKLPIHYFPEDEVRTELLEPTDHHTHCPWKGDASYWSVRVGDTVAENAVWGYPEPLPDAPPLAGHLAFYWDSMDEWLEEDEPLIGHARDPYHRVDVVDTSRAIRIEIDGDVVAETTRARALFETGLPTRWYIPPDDVRADLLTTSDTHSVCAYKGVASYRTVSDEADVAWFYPEPRREAERIRDHLCFFNERVDVYVDGELQERPESPWSHPTGR